MSDLKKGNDPRRLLSWNGKTIATCSKQELMSCVIHLAGQLAISEKNMQEASQRIYNLENPAEVTKEAVTE